MKDKKALLKITECLKRADNWPHLYHKCIDCVSIEALRIAKTALEKQIPKEPVEISDECPPCCPVCEQVAVGNYCWNCGQRLVWGDNK